MKLEVLAVKLFLSRVVLYYEVSCFSLNSCKEKYELLTKNKQNSLTLEVRVSNCLVEIEFVADRRLHRNMLLCQQCWNSVPPFRQ